MPYYARPPFFLPFHSLAPFKKIYPWHLYWNIFISSPFFFFPSPLGSGILNGQYILKPQWVKEMLNSELQKSCGQTHTKHKRCHLYIFMPISVHLSWLFFFFQSPELLVYCFFFHPKVTLTEREGGRDLQEIAEDLDLQETDMVGVTTEGVHLPQEK